VSRWTLRVSCKTGASIRGRDAVVHDNEIACEEQPTHPYARIPRELGTAGPVVPADACIY